MSEAAIALYLEKARRALDEAQLLLKDSKTEGACSRAYYAMHDAAHAALLATGNETTGALIKTHHSLIAAFGRTLVLAGRLHADHGRAFNRVHDYRLLADYSAEPPSVDVAKSAVSQAEAFVTAVSEMIARR